MDLFGSAMLLAGGVVLVVSARHVWRATAVVRATEMARFDHHDSGTPVRVPGRTTPETDDPLIAPFSGTDAVALRYRFEGRRLSFLRLPPWYATVHESTDLMPTENPVARPM